MYTEPPKVQTVGFWPLIVAGGVALSTILGTYELTKPSTDQQGNPAPSPNVQAISNSLLIGAVIVGLAYVVTNKPITRRR